MSSFETEIDLIQYYALRESFRYAKLIGLSKNEDDLKKYLLYSQENFFELDIIIYPNTPEQVAECIITY